MPPAYSMLDIRAALDPIPDWQPQTLLDVARRLRWEHHVPSNRDEPQRPVSFRHIAERIAGPRTERLRFLSYNTYVLPGFSPPIGRWIDDTIGWDALSWFGIPAGGGALLAYLGIVSIPGLVAGEILKELGWTPSKVLKDVANIDLDALVHIGAKPTRKQRADVIGRHLIGVNVYDVCCLCEVFDEEVRKRILGTLDASWDHCVGPDESGAWKVLGSGLMFLARRWPIVRHEQLKFSNVGDHKRDSDAWANKGILLNVLKMGAGELEIYQTHTFYGGGLEIVSDPSPEEQRAVRRAVIRAELDEIINFYNNHHNPRNVAVITGDFNLNGVDVNGEYADLARAFQKINVRDAWTYSGQGHRNDAGYTCRYTDGPEDENEKNFDNEIGGKRKLLEQDASTQASKMLTTYCEDDAVPENYQSMSPRTGAGRMDYVFIENPTAEHSYRLDVSRILRRPFPWETHDGDQHELFLSDHMGLDCTFFITPR